MELLGEISKAPWEGKLKMPSLEHGSPQDHRTRSMWSLRGAGAFTRKAARLKSVMARNVRRTRDQEQLAAATAQSRREFTVGR